MTRVIISFLILILGINIAAQENGICNISFEIKNHENNFISLAYHMGDQQFIKDTIYTDKYGKATFGSDEKIDRGMYMIVFPDNDLFELLISNDQNFSVSCDRNDIANTVKFEGSEENTAFLEYRKKWMDFQEKATQKSQMLRKLSDNDSIAILRKEISDLEKDILGYIRSTAKKYEGSLLSSILYSMLPVEMPEFEVEVNVNNADSVKWVMGYNYNKEHFFDNIRLDDPGLIRTPILHNKLMTFFSRTLIQAPDSLIPQIRKVVELASANRETFRYVTSFLFNHFRQSQIMGHDAIIVMLADEYYLNGKADWVSEEFLEQLEKDVAAIRPSLIGKKAADLTMETYSGVFRSLHDIKSDFTIVYFWEPNCGHCKKVTPALRDIYRKHKNGDIEVFAVCTQSDRKEWEDYIAENELDWINGWDPLRTTAYDFYYNVKATPLIYILNKDKEIIAKKLPVENIEDFISTYRRINKSKN